MVLKTMSVTSRGTCTPTWRRPQHPFGRCGWQFDMEPATTEALVDVFVHRCVATVEKHDQEQLDSRRAGLCVNLYGILRKRSYRTPDGCRMLCHFRAPDAESVRVALRVAATCRAWG